MKCKYLIYTCWETVLESGGTLAGSLLHPELRPETKEEATRMTAELKQRADSYHEMYNSTNKTTRTYVYIENKEEWWPKSK